ncbi:GntR family transcriptional regulator [Marinilactibacillus psychrotolerans]|uniref:GntR family transcriptional regulator n=1 Tax=Marinilactibacillus psychrotolerans TaxID=191770 RepID=UPI0039AF5A5A
MRLLTLDVIISNEIKFMIENKPILEGEKLPGERSLAEMLDVQRATIRKGLKILLQEGWIYSKVRSGYYVAPKRITKDVYTMASTTKTVLAMGKEMKLTVIEFEEKEVGKELSSKIKLPIGTRVFYMVRVREVENEKVSVELTYIPLNIAPTLKEYNFEITSLYDVLEKEYLVDLNHSKQTITVENADKKLAQYLNIAEGINLVKQEGLICDRDNKPVEYSISYMKMDRFQYGNINRIT